MMRTLKTGLLLTAMTLLLVFGGEALAGRQGMTFGLIIAIFMNGIAYFFSDKIALSMYSAQPVSETENPEVYRRVAPIVRNLVQKMGLPMPKLVDRLIELAMERAEMKRSLRYTR